MTAARHDEARRLLVEGILAIEAIGFVGSTDEAIEPFQQFQRAILRPSKSATEEVGAVLDELEPKLKILYFLADFSSSHRLQKKRVIAVLGSLLALPGWRAVAQADEKLNTFANELLNAAIEAIPLRTSPPASQSPPPPVSPPPPTPTILPPTKAGTRAAARSPPATERIEASTESSSRMPSPQSPVEPPSTFIGGNSWVYKAFYCSCKCPSKRADVTKQLNELLEINPIENFTGGQTFDAVFGDPAPSDWKKLSVTIGAHTMDYPSYNFIGSLRTVHDLSAQLLKRMEPFAWNAVVGGEPLPAGQRVPVGMGYVGRNKKTECGMLFAGEDGVLDKIDCHNRGPDNRGDLLVVRPGVQVSWQPIRRGDQIPPGAVYSGRTHTDGDIYVARVADVCGKLNIYCGAMWNIWCAKIGAAQEGEILVLEEPPP